MAFNIPPGSLWLTTPCPCGSCGLLRQSVLFSERALGLTLANSDDHGLLRNVNNVATATAATIHYLHMTHLYLPIEPLTNIHAGDGSRAGETATEIANAQTGGSRVGETATEIATTQTGGDESAVQQAAATTSASETGQSVDAADKGKQRETDMTTSTTALGTGSPFTTSTTTPVLAKGTESGTPTRQTISTPGPSRSRVLRNLAEMAAARNGGEGSTVNAGPSASETQAQRQTPAMSLPSIDVPMWFSETAPIPGLGTPVTTRIFGANVNSRGLDELIANPAVANAQGFGTPSRTGRVFGGLTGSGEGPSTWIGSPLRNEVLEEAAADKDAGKFIVCDHCMAHGLTCNEGAVCQQCKAYGQPCIHRWCATSAQDRERCPHGKCHYVHLDAVPQGVRGEKWVILRGNLPHHLERRRLVALPFDDAAQGSPEEWLERVNERQKTALILFNQANREGKAYAGHYVSCSC